MSRPIDLSRYEGHTPGPWHRTGDDDPDVVVFAGPEDVFVANVGRSPVQCLVMDIAEMDGLEVVAFDIDKANASLIADAPLLLAEVVRLTIAWREQCDFGDRQVTHLKAAEALLLRGSALFSAWLLVEPDDDMRGDTHQWQDEFSVFLTDASKEPK